MKRSHWNTTLVMLVMGVIGACGGDNNSGGGHGDVTVYTGLASNRALSSLTEADLQMACEAVRNASASLTSPTNTARSECFAKGLGGSISFSTDGGSLTVDVAKCRMVTDSCIADPASAGVDVNKEPATDIDCMGADPTQYAGCEATVGELEACFNAVFAAYTQVLASLTCDNGQKIATNGGPEEADVSMIPACVNIKTKCPSLDVPGQ